MHWVPKMHSFVILKAMTTNARVLQRVSVMTLVDLKEGSYKYLQVKFRMPAARPFGLVQTFSIVIQPRTTK